MSKKITQHLAYTNQQLVETITRLANQNPSPLDNITKLAAALNYLTETHKTETETELHLPNPDNQTNHQHTAHLINQLKQKLQQATQQLNPNQY